MRLFASGVNRIGACNNNENSTAWCRQHMWCNISAGEGKGNAKSVDFIIDGLNDGAGNSPTAVAIPNNVMSNLTHWWV